MRPRRPGRDQHRDRGQPDAGRRSGGCGRLLQDQVGVGPLNAERRHAARRGPLPRGQGRASVSSAIPLAAQSTCGVGSSACRVRGRGRPDRQHHLDDAADPGGGLGVPEVGLRRAEPQRPSRSVLAEGGQQRRASIGSPRRGAGAVGLDGVDVGGVRPASSSARRITRSCDGAVGRGEAVGGAVVVDGACPGSRPGPGGRRAGRPRGVRGAARRRPRTSRCRRRAAEKDLHRPSAASPRWRQNSTNAPGSTSR